MKTANTFTWGSCSQCANKKKEQSLCLDVAATGIVELLSILRRRKKKHCGCTEKVEERSYQWRMWIRVRVWTVNQNLAAAGMTLWTVSKNWQLQKQKICCVQMKWSTNIMGQRIAEMWLGWLPLLSIKWVSIWEMFLKVWHIYFYLMMVYILTVRHEQVWTVKKWWYLFYDAMIKMKVCMLWNCELRKLIQGDV